MAQKSNKILISKYITGKHEAYCCWCLVLWCQHLPRQSFRRSLDLFYYSRRLSEISHQAFERNQGLVKSLQLRSATINKNFENSAFYWPVIQDPKVPEQTVISVLESNILWMIQRTYRLTRAYPPGIPSWAHLSPNETIPTISIRSWESRLSSFGLLARLFINC